jgi:hypothetical protein
MRCASASARALRLIEHTVDAVDQALQPLAIDLIGAAEIPNLIACFLETIESRRAAYKGSVVGR